LLIHCIHPKHKFFKAANLIELNLLTRCQILGTNLQREMARKNDEISQFDRIINKFRYGLVLQAIRNKLARVGIEITPYYWFKAGFSDIELPEIKGLFSEYSVEFLDTKDLTLIGERARGYSGKKFLSWLKEGRFCLGLKRHDNIVSFLWINLKECTYVPRQFLLNKDEAYINDLYTIESQRGNNLAPYLVYKSYEILQTMGRDKICSVTEYFNTSAIKYKQKLKIKRLELVLFIRLFKKFHWSVKLKSYKEMKKYSTSKGGP
jgi:hypothetical protein